MIFQSLMMILPVFSTLKDFKEGPLEAIIVIFGLRALNFFCLKALR